MTNDKKKKLLLLTLSDNDAEALAALRTLQRTTLDWHAFVENIFPIDKAVAAPTQNTASQSAKPSKWATAVNDTDFDCEPAPLRPRRTFRRMSEAAKKQYEDVSQEQEELESDSDIYYFTSFRNKKTKTKSKLSKGNFRFNDPSDA